MAHGDYLSPEPLLQDSTWVSDEVRDGFSAPTYGYARNNPLKYTDPTGLFAWIEECEGGGVNVYVDRLDPGIFKFIPTASSVQFATGSQDACDDFDVAVKLKRERERERERELAQRGYSHAQACWHNLLKQMQAECHGVRPPPRKLKPLPGYCEVKQ